ncbi:MAG: ubiquinol-cytochrome c reductase cytochrome c subunit [Actinomycetota bacterium]|nr:ubiquinol-cytochrome c reductase cytochrome c subunit [Actinomycetota bacterium]
MPWAYGYDDPILTRVSGPLGLVLGLLVLGVFAAGAAAADRDRFVARCASCHGSDAAGTEDGPSLIGVGPAMVDFQLRTGRMPLADPGVQPKRKPPAFDEAEIAGIVRYVTSLGPGGPSIPSVDPVSGDLSLGQSLFVANCAPCHGATANGGAVGRGALAPSLSLASSLEIAEAMVVGPGEMPVFAFEQHEVDSIVAFVEDLEHRPDRGGADIGGVGPVPEGFVAWGVGMGSCIAIVWLIGRRRREP